MTEFKMPIQVIVFIIENISIAAVGTERAFEMIPVQMF